MLIDWLVGDLRGIGSISARQRREPERGFVSLLRNRSGTNDIESFILNLDSLEICFRFYVFMKRIKEKYNIMHYQCKLGDYWTGDVICIQRLRPDFDLLYHQICYSFQVCIKKITNPKKLKDRWCLSVVSLSNFI